MKFLNNINRIDIKFVHNKCIPLLVELNSDSKTLIENEIQKAFEFARSSPAPKPDTLFHFSNTEDIKCVPS